MVEILHQGSIDELCFFKVGGGNDVNAGMILCLIAIEGFYLIMGMQFTSCMSQVCHNLVSQLLEHETVISASTTMGFLKIYISLSDQFNDLLV